MVGKLATMHLVALLEDEGYEVDATREREMKVSCMQNQCKCNLRDDTECILESSVYNIFFEKRNYIGLS